MCEPKEGCDDSYRERKGSGTKERLHVEGYPSIPENSIFDPFPDETAANPANILYYKGNDNLCL
jgi:hypothetical protein